MYVLLFRVRRVYLDQIASGEKTVEVRVYNEYWTKRAKRAKEALEDGEAVLAKFICWGERHSRWVNSIQEYESPVEVLGREASEQGKLDIGTGRVWGFHLGEEVQMEHHFHLSPSPGLNKEPES